jgi:hypothetical protein
LSKIILSNTFAFHQLRCLPCQGSKQARVSIRWAIFKNLFGHKNKSSQNKIFSFVAFRCPACGIYVGHKQFVIKKFVSFYQLFLLTMSTTPAPLRRFLAA